MWRCGIANNYFHTVSVVSSQNDLIKVLQHRHAVCRSQHIELLQTLVEVQNDRSHQSTCFCFCADD